MESLSLPNCQLVTQHQVSTKVMGEKKNKIIPLHEGSYKSTIIVIYKTQTLFELNVLRCRIRILNTDAYNYIKLYDFLKLLAVLT